MRLGGCVSIHHVIVCRCEGGKKRCNNRKKCQNGYDDTADDRALVFAEALERALKIADGLCIEFAVVLEIPSGCELEFVRGDIGDIIHIIRCHLYFAPILILGSMKP